MAIFNEEDFNNGQEDVSIDFLQMMKDSYIDPKGKIEQQPVAISVGASIYKGNEYPIPFGSYGDFSCIVGSSKSRKTFLKSAFEASYIGGHSNLLFPSLKSHINADRYVIQIDTEQSKYHTQRVVHRICNMVQAEPENFKSFALRSYTPNERLQFIDWLVYESEFKNNIGLMTIDGYVDLVTDFNSLEQATNLSDKLMKWTAIKGLKPFQQMHISGILHKNFGTNKPVGHVGSSVLKKAETIAFVENNKETGNTIVTCEYSRNLPFDNFEFSVNDDWLPYEIHDKGDLPIIKNPKKEHYESADDDDAPF